MKTRDEVLAQLKTWRACDKALSRLSSYPDTESMLSAATFDDLEWVCRRIGDDLLAEYLKATQPAWAEYEKVGQSALAEYLKATQPALAKYEKATQPALAEYEKVRQSALAKYEKVEQPALAEYLKVASAEARRLLTGWLA